ncbi:unnamed protein product [Phyllotreta striolata]|uniref:Chibby n=1 Tax=Phyllotreta striolata TaxID=444603 RepID=A0A9N9XT67_PHYSR|nr:unnamed protein product [Phyllotreta striolata]
MPLFGNKFSPKKAPQRKSAADSPRHALTQLVSEERTVKLSLGDEQYLFDSGDWIAENEQHGMNKSKQKMKKKLQDLEEENNLLKLKYEMMLNMITQAAAKGDLNQLDITKTKKKK